MSTGYFISIGYDSGTSSPARLIGKTGATEAWNILKSVVEKLCGETERIVAETRAYGAPEHCERGPNCCTLQNHAERYKLPWQDRTIYFDDKKQEVIQMASGDRLLKEHICRAFCRLVMQEMHKLNIEINIEVCQLRW